MGATEYYRGSRLRQSQKWKFLLAGIVLALLLLFVRTDAQAADTSGSCGDNLTWAYDSDSGLLTITGYGEMTDYTSSSSAPWYDYRSSLTEVEFDCTNTSTGIEIGTYAFRNCAKITEADISGTVSVGSYAFYGCKSLEELSGTGAIKTVSDHAFYNCQSMNGFDISGVTSIDSYAFYNVTGFTEVTLNAALTEIADYAFQRCMNLESVVALGDLTAIGEGSFYQCYALDTLVYDEADADAGIVYIADTVETIGRQAFYQCVSYDEETGEEPAGGISEVVFLGTDVSFTSPSKKTESPFYQCKYLTGITLPSAQTEIAPYLLYECTSLTSVTIPETVTTIGMYAFSNTGLTQIAVPANVAEMGGYTFSDSPDLASVTFAKESDLAAIPAYAFSGTGISQITLPDSVDSVGDYAFKNCTSLTSITFGTGLTTLGNNIFYGCTQQLEMHFTGEYTYTDADGNTAELSIGSSAFNGINAYAYYPADSETWPSGTAVSTNAIYGATSLVWAAEGEEIVVSDWYYLDEDNGILYVYPDGAMTNYSQTSTPWYSKRASITEIVFGYDPQTEETHEITSIGTYAFYGFSSLESVTIPASVTSIGDYAFCRCKEYRTNSASLSGTIITTETITGGLATVVFEEGSALTQIGSYAFAECGNLSQITLPESLQEIGSYAFYDCGSLESTQQLVYTHGSGDVSNSYAEFVGLSSEVHELGVSGTTITEGTDYTVETVTDESNRTVTRVTFTEEFLEGLSAGNYTGSISRKANNTEMINFTLYIYDEDTAQEDKISAQTAVVSTGLSSIDLSNIISIGEGAFRDCVSLADITFGSSLETIGSNAFYGCDSLVSVDLPDSLQMLESHAFADAGLEQITLPAGVDVGSYAFSYCQSLSKIEFEEDGDGVTLGDYAFTDCISLHDPVLPAGITQISSGLFSECSMMTSLTLQGAVTQIGEAAFSECAALESVTGLANITSIADEAFYDCLALTTLDLPEDLTNDMVGDFVFYSCAGLADENGFVVIGGVLYSYVYSILEDEAGSSTTVAEDDSSSSDYIRLSVIDAVTVPETVTEIANYAFYQIYALKTGANTSVSAVTLEGLIFTCSADDITFEEYAMAGLPILTGYTGYSATILYPCTDAEAWEAKLDAYGLNSTDETLNYRFSTGWTLVAEANHDYGEGTVTKEATCTEEGEISYTCSICGESTTEEIAATGHSYGEGTVTQEATCTEDGSISYTCTVCGETYTEAIAAAGHSWNDGEVTQEATCTEDGEMTYACTVCGETYTEAITATGHSWNNGEVTQEATCVDDGELTYSCTVCGETYTEAIAATGEHDYEVVVTEPTCTEAGEKSYVCAVCGDVAETEVIDALSETGEHSYTSEVTTEATCVDDGEMTYTCTVCGDTYTEVIAATGEHDYKAVVTEPTETEQGYTIYTCTVCGDSYVSDYTDPTGGSDDADGSGDSGDGSTGSEENGEEAGGSDGGTEDGTTGGSGSDGENNSVDNGTGDGATGGGTALQPQKITVKKTVKKTLKAKKLKKKAQTFKVKAKAKGKVTFKKKSGSKKVKISKTGKVTVKKGTKKGVYKIKVKVTAAKTAAYKKAAKTITVKVTVK